MDEIRRRAIVAAIPLTGALCATAGSIDAIAYILFGKIFIANMTGNTVLFAVSVALHNWYEASLRIGVVVAYLVGVFVSHAVLRRIALGSVRSERLIVLAVEFVVLVALALTSPPEGLRLPLLALLAVAMGMQNNAFMRIGPLRINTTFVTGDLENLGEALAEARTPGKRAETRARMAIFLTTWIAYAVGALVGGYGASKVHANAMWFPAALVAVASVLVFHRSARPMDPSPAKEP